MNPTIIYDASLSQPNILYTVQVDSGICGDILRSHNIPDQWIKDVKIKVQRDPIRKYGRITCGKSGGKNILLATDLLWEDLRESDDRYRHWIALAETPDVVLFHELGHMIDDYQYHKRLIKYLTRLRLKKFAFLVLTNSIFNPDFFYNREQFADSYVRKFQLNTCWNSAFVIQSR